MSLTKRTILLAAASAAALTAGHAAAQNQDRTVDVITVTAQKREEGIQDVPVAVTAYNEELLTNAGVRDLKDLAVIAPGLNVTSTSNEFQTTARIRGIGTVGDNPGLESSVGVVINGVPRARNGVGFGDLGEIERIEVLRGPQGTLFGANTSAGIINVVTKRPEYEFGAHAEATVSGGGADGWGVAGGMTGGLSDNVAARIYGASRQRDGFQSVQTFGGPRTTTEDANQDFYTLNGQVLFDISDNVNLLLGADYTSRDEDCCLGTALVSGPTAPIINALVPGARPMPGQEEPFSRVAQANRSTLQDIEDYGFQGELNWAFDNFDLTVIASDRSFSIANGQDVDFTGMDAVYRLPEDNTVDVDVTTFEARLSGATENLDWMVGTYYSDETLVRRDSILVGPHFEPFLSLLASSGASTTTVADLANAVGAVSAAVGNPMPGFTGFAPGTAIPAGAWNPGGDMYDQQTEALSFFTHNTWHLTDATDLTFGLRYTSTEKTATFDWSDSSSPACSVWEHAFGPALDFASPANQAFLGVLSGATGLPGATLAQFGTFSCLPQSRDVYSMIDHTQSLEEEEMTGLLSLSHRFNEDLLMYGTYSRGYKAGGFNLDRFTQAGSDPVDFTAVLANPESYPATFDPEIVDSFELGIKTEWLSDSVLANFYVFYSDFESYQLNTFNGIGYFVTSVPGASTQGAELELLWLPREIDGLTLQGGITYADATYDEFAATGTPDVDRLSGQNFSLAPEWYASGAITYEGTLENGLGWLAHLDGRWMSEQNTGSDLDPEKMQDGYALFNARVGIGAVDDSWNLELWSQNITDEDYIQVGFDGPFQAGSFNAFLGRPRTYGVTLRLRR